LYKIGIGSFDIFGESGRYILSCLMEGKSIEDIIESLPSRRIKNKADLIREAIMSSLEVSQIIQIRGSLKVIDAIQERIDELDREIQSRDIRRKNDLRIAMSIPGVGFISAAAILAEIGNYADFKNPEQLAAGCTCLTQQNIMSLKNVENLNHLN
jgi:transposase